MVDPFLYLALGLGFAAGRLTTWRSPWVERATLADIVALVFLLGVSLSAAPGLSLLATVPLALGFAALLLALAVGLTFLLPRRATRAGTGRRPRPLGAFLLLALGVGYALGRFVPFGTASFLTGALYLLLALVAFDLKLHWAAVRSAPTPVLAAIGGALLAAGLFALVTGLSFRVALATGLGFGWYTLAGPLVSTSVGPVAGLLAFLTNFLRENLTMIIAPYAGPRIRAEGIAAMGGATTMDATLYFVTAYGDAEAGALALANGLVLTLIAGLVVPLVLSTVGG